MMSQPTDARDGGKNGMQKQGLMPTERMPSNGNGGLLMPRKKQSLGSWNQKLKSALYSELADDGSVHLAGVLTSLGLLGLASLIWINSASAALIKSGAQDPLWKKGVTAYRCEDRLANLFLSGTFTMPGTGEAMNLWVGKPRIENGNEVWGLVSKASDVTCEAQCKVMRFERFQKDLKPALMEMDCNGMALKTMRMPLHVQWTRELDGFDTKIRLGSSVYGMEEAPLHVAVNRYAVPPVAKANKAARISGIMK
jgi:hypothetical protein